VTADYSKTGRGGRNENKGTSLETQVSEKEKEYGAEAAPLSSI